jgi:hypothetical protein
LISDKDRPQLAGSVQQITAGGYNNGHDTIAVVTIGVQNSGSMQSIAKNWSLTAKIGDNSYEGSFIIPPPKAFTFTLTETEIKENSASNPTGITYQGADNILDKVINPIPPGGLTEGLLFVQFRGVAPTVFATGASYTVAFEDVFDRKYSIPFSSSAKKGPFMMVSGLHSDLVCPAPSVPPNGAPGVPNATPVPSLPKL